MFYLNIHNRNIPKKNVNLARITQIQTYKILAIKELWISKLLNINFNIKIRIVYVKYIQINKKKSYHILLINCTLYYEPIKCNGLRDFAYMCYKLHSAKGVNSKTESRRK